MIYMALISQEQAEELTGQQYADVSYFNPIQVSGEWYISAEEVRDCDTVDWVKELEVIKVEIPVTDFERP
jgi:hypothetical protein